MTDEELHGRVVEWVAKIVGVPTIRAYQGGPRPAAIYAEVNFMNSRDVREYEQTVEYIEDETETVTASPSIETEWFYSVHCYGEGASGFLDRINGARRLPELAEPLGRGLVIHDTSEVRHLPEFVNSEWEVRANLDMFVRGMKKNGFVVNVIDEIEFKMVTKGSH